MAELPLAPGIATAVVVAGGLLLAALSTVANLGTARDFIGYDGGASLLQPSTNAEQLDVWNRLYAPGSPSLLALMAAPWVRLSEFLTRTGVDSMVVQRAFYGALIASAFVGAYFMVATVSRRLLEAPSNIVTVAASVIAAFWYAFNPYSMLLMTFPSTPHELTWALLPWGLALVVRGVHSGGSARSAVIVAVVWAVIFTGNVGLTAVSVAAAAILAGVSITARRARGQSTPYKYLGTLIVLTGLLTCFAWAPILFGNTSPVGGSNRINDLSTNVVEAARYNSIQTSLWNVFRLQGSAALPEQSYYTAITQGLPLLSTIVFPTLAIAAIFLASGRGRRVVAAVGIMGGIFLLLAKGEHQPLGEPMTWLYGHLPAAGIFRNSYDKFMLPVMIAQVIMIGAAIFSIVRLPEALRNSVFALAILTAGAFPFFFVTGRVADPRYLVQVPPEYQSLKGYLASQNPRPTIFSGPDVGGRAYYTWYQGNVTPDPVLLGVSSVTEQWLRYEGLVPSGQSPDYHEFAHRSLDLLPVLGVRYVLVHKDVLAYIRTGEFAAPLEIATQSQKEAYALGAEAIARRDMSLVMDNRYFSLFEYCSGAVRPQVYVTANVAIDDPSSFASSGGQQCDPPSGLATVVQSAAQVVTGGASLPKLTVLSSSASQYIIRIAGSQAASVLVLSQTFDADWDATARDTSGSGGPTHLQHVVANRFLNGWVISGAGDYTIDIRYRPRAAAELGAKISEVGIVLGVIVLVIGGRRLSRLRMPSRRRDAGSLTVISRPRSEAAPSRFEESANATE